MVYQKTTFLTMYIAAQYARKKNTMCAVNFFHYFVKPKNNNDNFCHIVEHV